MSYLPDKQFLQWIHDRLELIYKEPKNIGFMHRLREIIEKTPMFEDQYAGMDGSSQAPAGYKTQSAEDAVREALAAPMQPSELRPCGYVSVDGTARMCRKCGQVHADPIYATPAPTQAPAKPLNDEQIIAIRNATWNGPVQPWGSALRFARAIEAAHDIGDQP